MSQPRANAPRPNGLEPHDHQLLRKLLHDRTGVVLDTSRDYFVEMRLGALATEAGFDSLPDGMDALRTEETWGVLHRMVVETLAIGIECSWSPRSVGLTRGLKGNRGTCGRHSRA